MLNPFLTDSPHEARKAPTAAAEEQGLQYHDHPIASPATRNWIWRLGSLLIRIGGRLTKESPAMSSVNRNA